MAAKKNRPYFPSGKVFFFCTNVKGADGKMILTTDDCLRALKTHESSIEHYAFNVHDEDKHTAESIAERDSIRLQIVERQYSEEMERLGFTNPQDLKYDPTGRNHNAQNMPAVNAAWAYANYYCPPKKIGDDKEVHIHCAIKTKSVRRVDEIMRWFGVPPYLCKLPKGRGAFEDCCDYLIHRRHPDKYPYDVRSVYSDFDFVSWLDERTVREELHTKYHIGMDDLNDVVNAIATKGMTIRQAEDIISVPIALRNAQLLRKARDKYIYEHIPMPAPRQVYFIDADGKSGAGKSACTKAFCKQLARSFYGADASKSMDELKEFIYKAGKKGVAWQRYDGQPIVYIDDRDAGAFLREFGGHEGVKNLLEMFPEKDSEDIKYGDAVIVARFIVINGIQPFADFMNGLNGQYKDKKTGVQVASDTDITQYARRFTGIIRLTEEYIVSLFNKGIMTDTDEYNEFVAIKAMKANFVHTVQTLQGSALAAVEERVLAPTIAAVAEIDEKKNDKIVDPNAIPQDMWDYGTETDIPSDLASIDLKKK